MRIYSYWFLSCIIFYQLGFAMPIQIGGRLNKSQDQDEETVPDPKPKPLSSAVWSAEGYASADTISASIGYAMLKYGTIAGITAAIIILIFSQGEEGGGTTNGHGHALPQHLLHEHAHQ